MIPDLRGKRVAFLGIGNELKGDDAAGVLASRLLKKGLQPSGLLAGDRQGAESGKGEPAVLVIEAGLAPENFSGTLRRFRAEWVLMIDAAEMGLPAGAVQYIEWENITGFSGSTHLLPPSVMAKYLIDELDCQVGFIGIQPVSTEFGAPLSKVVGKAVRRVVKEIINHIYIIKL